MGAAKEGETQGNMPDMLQYATKSVGGSAARLQDGPEWHASPVRSLFVLTRRCALPISIQPIAHPSLTLPKKNVPLYDNGTPQQRCMRPSAKQVKKRKNR